MMSSITFVEVNYAGSDAKLLSRVLYVRWLVNQEYIPHQECLSVAINALRTILDEIPESVVLRSWHFVLDYLEPHSFIFHFCN